MISQIYILSRRGTTLYRREFKPNLPRNLHELFFREFKENESEAKPVFSVNGICFYWLDLGFVYLIAASGEASGPALVFDILRKIADNLEDFCGVLNEDSLRKNFFMVYEIIDEMIVNGGVQITDACDVNNLVFSEFEKGLEPKKGLIGKIDDLVIKTQHKRKETVIPIRGDNAGKFEMFVDLVEKVILKFNKVGWIIDSQIFGEIRAKAFLERNSDVHFKTNFKKLNEKFCCMFGSFVNSEDFELNGRIKAKMFKGGKKVMSYRVESKDSEPVLFKVHPFLNEITKNKVEICLKVSSQFNAKISCRRLLVKFKVPKEGNFKLSFLKNEQKKDQKIWIYGDEVNWELEHFGGGIQHGIVVLANLNQEYSTVKNEIGPVQLEFEIFNFCPSGLRITKVDVIDPQSKKKPKIWVRRCTKAASYLKEI